MSACLLMRSTVPSTPLMPCPQCSEQLEPRATRTCAHVLHRVDLSASRRSTSEILFLGDPQTDAFLAKRCHGGNARLFFRTSAIFGGTWCVKCVKQRDSGQRVQFRANGNFKKHAIFCCPSFSHIQESHHFLSQRHGFHEKEDGLMSDRKNTVKLEDLGAKAADEAPNPFKHCR